MSTSLRFPEEITHANVESVVSNGLAVMKAIPTGGFLSINCQDLQTFDSSALSVILSLKRQAEIQTVTIQLDAVPEKLASLAKVYGLADVVLA